MKTHKKFALLFFVSIFILSAMLGALYNTLVAADLNVVTAVEETEELNVKIALFGGWRTWSEGKTAITNMFEWVGASVTIVYADDIRSGCLDNFDVVVMPGGNAYYYSRDLGSEGMSKIRGFVNDGGGYIGICAGSYLACDYIIWEGHYEGPYLGIFPGYGVGSVHEITIYPDYNMTKINIVNHTHPITYHLPDYEWILYYGGPEFYPYEGENVTILGRYDVTGEPAIVAFEYGSGRVFLTGPHPEIEEDDTRDGVSWGDWMEDEGSDWPLMHAALHWLTGEPALATIDVDPDTLNLKSMGKWITAYIELPEGYNVSDINVTSILLNDIFRIDHDAPVEIGDYDNDGIPDLMVKFNRTELRSHIYCVLGIKYGNVTLTITGQLFNGTSFEGGDTIRVMFAGEIFAGDINRDGFVNVIDLAMMGKAWGTTKKDVNYNPGADLDSDGRIGIIDLAILCIDWRAEDPL